MPKAYLLSMGLPNMPICIRPTTLRAKVKKHGLTSEMIKYLPTDLNNPIMVFKSDIYTGGLNLIVGRVNAEGLLCVCLHPNRKANKIEINEIASIHGRNIEQLGLWANLGLLIDGKREKTEKVLQWLAVTSAKSEHLLSKIDEANMRLKTESAKGKEENNRLGMACTPERKTDK